MNFFPSGFSPPPAARRDVAGSDGLSRPKMVPPSSLQPQKANPKAKEDYQYDSRRSETGDEQVGVKVVATFSGNFRQKLPIFLKTTDQ
jgi:hypothetical protein